jgi:hypothetical protein
LVLPDGGISDVIIDLVDVNATCHLLWAVMKPQSERTVVFADAAYLALINGLFMGFRREPSNPLRPTY